MTPFPDPVEFLDDFVALTGDRWVRVEVHDTPECLRWAICWAGPQKTELGASLQITTLELGCGVGPHRLIRVKLQELLRPL